VLKGNILQIYGDEPSVDGAPVAEGEISGLLEGALFLGLKTYYEKVCIAFVVGMTILPTSTCMHIASM
jgi:hypothetical protein